MRFLSIALLSVGLVSCDSGEVPTPTEQQTLRPPSPEVEVGSVELSGDGLTAGPEAFYFAAGRSEVETALAGALGKASGTGENEECGLEFSDYSGGLTVNFDNGSMVGWNLRLPQDGDATTDVDLSVVGDVQLETAQAEAEASDGFAPFADSTLGEEFMIGDKVGGFFEEDSVSMLYAGRQCFFR